VKDKEREEFQELIMCLDRAF